MNHCIFHIGMHKTGTSSIQESLYYGLRDPSFLYFGFGEPNGSRGLKTLFGDDPEFHIMNRKMGLSGERMELYKRRLQRRLEQAMDGHRPIGKPSSYRLNLPGTCRWRNCLVSIVSWRPANIA